MNFAQTWSAERVRAVMTTESRQKSRGLFLSTHYPFRRIRTDFCKEEATAAFIDEEALRAIIHAGRLQDDNRLFFVVGEAGCGKSELCQWLEYTADADSRIAVHIPRSMTSAIGVASLLRARLGLVAGSTFHATPLGMQAQLITLSALTHWYEVGSAELAPSEPWDRILLDTALSGAVAAYLGRAAADLAPSGPIVDDALFDSVCKAYGLHLDDRALAAKAAAVHELFVHAMERILWTSDVRALLRSLSSRAVESGHRPLLLIEDITAFQTFGDVLLDYLLDLTSGHMDAVIGVTTGFERTQLPRATLSDDLTHVHQRLRARFVITDEHGCTYGLEEGLVEFARGYLHAVKEADTNVRGQVTPPGFDPDLYPFTETALRRAFAYLEEDGNARQTPRLFIEHVLAAVLISRELPPVTLDASRYLRQPPSYIRRDAASEATLTALLRWYGDVDDTSVTLDARIPAAWDIAVPPQAIHDGILRFPRAYIVRSVAVAESIPEHDHQLAELQRWLDHGGQYPTRETLKRAVEHVIRDIGDPRALGSRDSISQNRAELYYARGDERLPIHLTDGSGDVNYPGGAVTIEVTRQPEERAILEELVLRELNGLALADVCHNLALTLEWAHRHFEAYQRELRTEFASRLGGVDPDELILLSWRLVAALCGAPWGDGPHLSQLVLPDLACDTIGPWDRTAHPACYAAGKAVVAWQEEIRRLFVGAFTLHDTFLDIERFRAVSNRTEAQQTLARLAVLPTNLLGSFPFKIKPGGYPLQHMLLDLRRYVKALLDLDVSAALAHDLDELSHRREQLRAQRPMDFDQLRAQLQELRERYSIYNVAWRPAWDDALRVLSDLHPDTLSSLLEDIDLHQTQGMTHQEEGCNIWDYQAWRINGTSAWRHPYWDACHTLAIIQDELLMALRQRIPKAQKDVTKTREYRAFRATVRAYSQEVGQNGSGIGG